MADEKPLFHFKSRIDGKPYAAVWDRDEPRLRVNAADPSHLTDKTGEAWPSTSPFPPAPPVYPASPLGNGSDIDPDVVRAFEEGRLNTSGHDCPYTHERHPRQKIAYAFGAFFR